MYYRDKSDDGQTCNHQTKIDPKTGKPILCGEAAIYVEMEYDWEKRKKISGITLQEKQRRFRCEKFHKPDDTEIEYVLSGEKSILSSVDL